MCLRRWRAGRKRSTSPDERTSSRDPSPVRCEGRSWSGSCKGCTFCLGELRCGVWLQQHAAGNGQPSERCHGALRVLRIRTHRAVRGARERSHKPLLSKAGCLQSCGLTSPSSGRPKGRCAPFAPPLMSNVRPLLCYMASSVRPLVAAAAAPACAASRGERQSSSPPYTARECTNQQHEGLSSGRAAWRPGSVATFAIHTTCRTLPSMSQRTQLVLLSGARPNPPFERTWQGPLRAPCPAAQPQR